MNKTDFRKKCESIGLTSQQSEVCYFLWECSRNIQWSVTKAQDNFTPEQYLQAELAFLKQMDMSEVDIFFKVEYTSDQMEEARIAIDNKMPTVFINKWYRPEFGWDQMRVGREYVQQVSAEDFELIYKSEYSAAQMQVAFKKILSEPDVSDEVIEKVYKNRYSPKQMSLAFESGLSAEDLDIFYVPEVSVECMQVAVEGIKYGLPKETMIKIVNSGLQHREMNEINTAACFGVPIEKLEYFFNDNWTYDKLKTVRLCLQAGKDFDLIKQYFKPSMKNEQLSVLKEALLQEEMELSREHFELLVSGDMAWNQMQCGLNAILDGLTIEQIKTFYLPRCTVSQMEQASIAYKDGLPTDQIMFLINTQMSEWDRIEARKCFEAGLDINEVLEHLNLSFETEDEVKEEKGDDERALLSFFDSM